MKKRNQILRKKAFERDNHTCKKCGLQDKEAIRIEAHHIIPLYAGGKDELDNLITLCFDCHHFAPDKKEDFDEYMKEECDGTMTTFLKAWKIVREKHPELFESRIKTSNQES